MEVSKVKIVRSNAFDTPTTLTRPRFAPVIPPLLARDLENVTAGCIGDYHLLLAHDVLQYPEIYREVYANKGYTLLMDNSLVELGHALPIGDVLKACQIVGAQFAILPDVRNDKEGTMRLTDEALDQWTQIDEQERTGIQLLPVLQGKNLREMTSFLAEYADHIGTEIAGFCIPRCIADSIGTRRNAIDIATDFGCVHLLGFSEDLMDDIACARMPGVVGIDSMVPIRLGLRGHYLSLDFPADAGKRHHIWEDPYEGKEGPEQYNALRNAEKNMSIFRNFIRVNMDDQLNRLLP